MNLLQAVLVELLSNVVRTNEAATLFSCSVKSVVVVGSPVANFIVVKGTAEDKDALSP